MASKMHHICRHILIDFFLQHCTEFLFSFYLKMNARQDKTCTKNYQLKLFRVLRKQIRTVYDRKFIYQTQVCTALKDVTIHNNAFW